jgi:acetamidase/formamidase
LQKLFEGVGDSFTHYVRERRLQRTAADLASPGQTALTVSEIAFRCGFNDAAHFSRMFRARFGMAPRDFRQQQSERLAAPPNTYGQRGWPQNAPPPGRDAKSTTIDQPIDLADRRARSKPQPERPTCHHLAVDASRVHWGFFSRALPPQIEVASGDIVTIETLTQHASDDPALMITGDPGAESVFRWTAGGKGVSRRGAGPMDGSIYGRGAGEGFGVHICTGPIAVRGAVPGDVLEVRILDIAPRPCRNPAFAGRVFGSSVAAWWGYHFGELLEEPKQREVVTIYEIDTDAAEPYARALYSFRWTPQTDPFGTVHRVYDYPGVPVDPATITRCSTPLTDVRIPLRPHFGVIAVAPKEAELVDSVPPAYFGGNLDNWRLGKGAAVYLPVSVPGALLSIGDPHAAQGDGELSGTAIECSMTGTFAITLHKRADLDEGRLADLTSPLIETETNWVLTGFSHPNYLAEFGAKGRSEVYAKSSLDLAMKDAFRKARRFLMSARGLTEDEAIALMSAAVDFGVTQVVDGNWGVHAVISKRLFA